MMRTDGEVHLLPAQRHNFDSSITLRVRDQAKVDDVADYIVVNLVCAAVFDVDVDRGIRFEKPLQVWGQVVEPDTVNRCHAHSSGNDVFDLLQLVVKRIVRVDDLLTEIVKHLPLAS